MVSKWLITAHEVTETTHVEWVTLLAIIKIIELLLHLCNGLFSRPTLGKLEARDDGVLGWQWHQLDHMQTVCTSLQTHNHTSTSSLNFSRPLVLPDAQPTVSEHWRQIIEQAIIEHCRFSFSIFNSWFSAVKLTRVSFWVHVKTTYLVIWYHCQYSTMPLLMDHRWHTHTHTPV